MRTGRYKDARAPKEGTGTIRAIIDVYMGAWVSAGSSRDFDPAWEYCPYQDPLN
jgi:hypothetical protein